MATSMAKAAQGICARNQTGDQAQLSSICAAQNFMAPDCGAAIQMRQPATAIMT